MIDIKQDRDLCARATPGPWETSIYAPATYRNSVLVSNTGEIVARSSVDDNTEFIARARTALPEYMDEVERLQKELAAIKEAARQAHICCRQNMQTDGRAKREILAALETIPDLFPKQGHEVKPARCGAGFVITTLPRSYASYEARDKGE